MLRFLVRLKMFNKRILLPLLLVGLLTPIVNAKPTKILDLYYSCCRVRVSGAAGSGTCIGEKGDNYVFLSNAHVRGNSSTGVVEMWPAGNLKTMQGTWTWKKYEGGMSVDLAILEVPKSQFEGWKPVPLKIADYDLQLQQNSYIFSIGSPRAYYSLAWNGRVYEVNNATFTFKPVSIGGQSGSSILANVWNKETKEYDTKIVGVLTWSTGNLGAAQRHQVVLDAIAGRVAHFEPIPESWKEIETRTTQLEKIPDHWKPVQQVKLDPLPGFDFAMVCPYCGLVHTETYAGPCPGGNCPIIGGGGQNPSPQQPSPEYPDLTQPPILDGPPKDDDVDKSVLQILQESIKSAQDAIKNLQGRVSALEGGGLNIFGSFRKYVMWGAVGLLAFFFLLLGYNSFKKSKADSLKDYPNVIKRQINATNSGRRVWSTR